ncbi:MAG: HAD family hydrolase [Planctomycetes bacterium]|nr:HAD family hydrolase [Planctomycetota bacterium]
MKAVLFDLGDTLFGYGAGTTTSMGYTGAKRTYDRVKELGAEAPGYTAYYAKVTAIFAKMAVASSGPEEINIREQIHGLFSDLGMELEPDHLNEAIRTWYGPFSDNLRLLDETPPVLAALREKGLRLGIVSNTIWPGWLIEEDLKKAGIREFFDCVVVSSDIGIRKPAEAIFKSALERLSLPAEECVFVGDSIEVDVVGAQQVGMKSILVERREEAGPEPDARIPSLAELESVLERL